MNNSFTNNLWNPLLQDVGMATSGDGFKRAAQRFMEERLPLAINDDTHLESVGPEAIYH